MRKGDFGAQEVLFILCLTLLAVLLAWFLTWAFTVIVQAIAGIALIITFFIYGSLS